MPHQAPVPLLTRLARPICLGCLALLPVGLAAALAWWIAALPPWERPALGRPLEIWVTQAAKGHLAGADLRGARLSGADLSRANLRGAALGPGRMRVPAFHGGDAWIAVPTELRGTDLRRIDAVQAVFSSARMSDCDLRHARLDNAVLTRADLSGANASRASFQGADLMGANFDRAQLCGADFSRASLCGATFVGAVHDSETRWPPDSAPDLDRAIEGACQQW